MKFTIKLGERNGVYLNVSSIKHGMSRLLTIKCDVCGSIIERSDKTLRHLDLSHCICDKMKCKNKYRKHRGDAEQWEMSKLRLNFNVTLRRKLTLNPSLKYDPFDKIIKAVGQKPPDTETYHYELRIKNHGRKCKDMTADNYEWCMVFSSKAKAIAKSVTGKSGKQNERYLKAYIPETKEELERQLSIIRTRKKELSDDYAHFVGKKKGTFVVLDLSKTFLRGGSTRYDFLCECSKCGKRAVYPAHKFLNLKPKCSCRFELRNLGKNSSACKTSKFWEMKQRWVKKQSGLSADELLILKRSMSEFSLYAGTLHEMMAAAEIWCGVKNYEAWRYDLSLCGGYE